MNYITLRMCMYIYNIYMLYSLYNGNDICQWMILIYLIIIWDFVGIYTMGIYWEEHMGTELQTMPSGNQTWLAGK